MSPFFSIIIPAYNKQNFIADTIESLLQQSFHDFEVLVIDDLSSDNTVNYIEGICRLDKRIKLICNQKNSGANYCRNTGFVQSAGSYIIFLDADDIFTRDCLANRYRMIFAYPHNDLWVSTMGVFKQTIGDDARLWLPFTKNPLRDFLNHKLPWQTMQPVWQRSFLNKMNGFDENFKRLQDVEFHTRALLIPGIRYYLENGEPDCYYRIDLERRNYNTYLFLAHRAEASVMYCDKFIGQLSRSYQQKLHGTIFQTYLQLLYYRRSNELSRKEFTQLESVLFQAQIYKNASRLKKLVYAIFRRYNLSSHQVPGINVVLRKINSL